MPQKVIMPKLGQTVEESTIVKWHKNEGDTVAKGDVLFEIETDKAVLEANSFYDGTLLKVIVGEGISAPVKSVVAFIGEPGEEVPEVEIPKPAAQKAKPAAKSSGTPAAAAATPAPSAAPAGAAPVAVSAPVPAASEPAILRVSPRARRLAREKCIDPSKISGSGPLGRIIERDVTAYLQDCGYDNIRISPAAMALARSEGLDILEVIPSGPDGRILREDVQERIDARPEPMSRMRQVIAERLSTSFATAPHFYVTVETDVTELLALRAELKAAGRKFTVNDFIMKAVTDALVEFPGVNSVCDGRSVSRRRHVHLGVAVALDTGLVVPVVRNAHKLGLAELGCAARDLVGLAREGKLTPDLMTGGTFTISNMGMLDVENFGAIINPGETAILAVASAREMPVVRDGQIVARTMMKLTLSADHRMIDGAEGAKFINAIKSRLEDIDLWRSLT